MFQSTSDMTFLCRCKDFASGCRLRPGVEGVGTALKSGLARAHQPTAPCRQITAGSQTTNSQRCLRSHTNVPDRENSVGLPVGDVALALPFEAPEERT